MSLRIENVTKSFREPGGTRLPILDIRQFQLRQGEQVVLLGQSGCGKTTLLNVIAGISTADSGTIEVAGYDVSRLSEPARDRFRAQFIGIVFQTFNLLPGFSALENVMLGMTFSGRSDKSRARKLLEEFGLGDRLQHRPGQLSVGEQQRVAVARALANRPKLLLADEPTASVDIANQEIILKQIRNGCREQDVSLLLVTHSPEVSRQFDRVENLTEFNLAARRSAAKENA
jgi:putative ABC transport system ATP-binding protein